MFERLTRPADRPGKGGLWRIVPNMHSQLPVSRHDSNRFKKRRHEPEAHYTQDSNLMDTLATLALSVDSQPLGWGQPPMEAWIPYPHAAEEDSLHSYLQSPFMYRPDLQMRSSQEQRHMHVMFDPSVGGQTLFQLTAPEDHPMGFLP